MNKNRIRVGICQMAVRADKRANLAKAQDMIATAAVAGCQVAILPEMFTCPYEMNLFSQYAERYPEGETFDMLSTVAAREKIAIVGGSLPERGDDEKIYNTSFVFDEHGQLVGRHRKIHLFDVDILGGTVCQESTVLSAGQEMTVLPVAGVNLGIGICYDIRFPELARLMTLAGAKILIFPAVFGLTTGPAHWELVMRARAVDNQVFVIGAAPANVPQGQVYGHSLGVNPWGEIMAMAGTEETVLTVDIQLEDLQTVRNQLPLLQQRRLDVYEVSYKK